MRGDGYVPNLKAPGRRKPSHLMWVTVLLCALLPPVGLVLLWGKARCPLRGKLWLTLLSVSIMVAVMTLFFESRNQDSFIVPQAPVTYTYGGSLPTPTPEPSAAPAPAPEEAIVPAADPNIIPANPIG